MNTVEEMLEATGSVWLPEATLKDVNLRATNLVRFNGMVTTKEIAMTETRVAENVMNLLFRTQREYHNENEIDQLIKRFEIEENEGRELHYRQKDAVKMVINNSISVLTGGPGTGKTTVLSAIAYCLRVYNPSIRISYTAPTGKAANRIKESTGENAVTLQKKLGIGYEHKAKIIWDDIIFVDESSMMDLLLADEFFASIPIGTKVVIIGDVDQLPSVGIGAVLRDLILSKSVPCTMLTKTFRQDNSSTLFQNIKNIREGKTDIVEGSDYHATEITANMSLNDIAVSLRSTYMDAVKKYGIENVCLLLPYRQSRETISTDVMNPFLQRSCNPKKSGFKAYGEYFCESDLVMQLENREKCANGDVGKVIEVSPSGVRVEFTEGIATYNRENIGELTLAYAMTIHKSQGSEYKCVIMCLLDSHEAMLNRNLVYTGITRAKKECILFYQPEAYKKAIKTKADQGRFSFLAEKLKSLYVQYLSERYAA